MADVALCLEGGAEGRGYSYACPGYGNPVAELMLEWQLNLADTMAQLASGGDGNTEMSPLRVPLYGSPTEERLAHAYDYALQLLATSSCNSLFEGVPQTVLSQIRWG